MLNRITEKESIKAFGSFINHRLVNDAMFDLFSVVAKQNFSFTDSFIINARLNNTIDGFLIKHNINKSELKYFKLRFSELMILSSLDKELRNIKRGLLLIDYDRGRKEYSIISTKKELLPFWKSFRQAKYYYKDMRKISKKQYNTIMKQLSRKANVENISKKILEEFGSYLTNKEKEVKFFEFCIILQGLIELSALRKDIKKILMDKIDGKNLYETEELHKILSCYDNQRETIYLRPFFKVLKDGEIGEFFHISEEDFLSSRYSSNDAPFNNSPFYYFPWTTGYEILVVELFIKYFIFEKKHSLKRCKYCNKFLIPSHGNAILCNSNSCKRKYEREKKRKQREEDPLKYI